ncbi:MAG: glycosyltransferase family 2 protein, partial [Rickettsiales bacterium]
MQATRDSMRAQENALLHKIEEERARANNLLREVQQREAQIYEMKYSTIWRLSEPLRNIGSKAPWLARLVRLGLRVVAKVVRSLRVHRKIREWWQSREAHRHMEVMRFFRREWYAASEAQRSIKQIWPSLLGYLRQASRSEVAALPPLPTIQRHYPEWNHARETAFLNDIEALYSRDPAAYDAVKISIVMPSWNRGDRICPSIESVLAQTHQNWELFVVDDGSEDNTEEVVTAYAEKDPRIHYQKQERSGVSAARNRGIDAATGEYIFYLDSDNSWLPDYAHRMLVFLKAGKLDAGYAGIEATNDAGKTDFFRGDEFHWQSCFEANYVDLNCFAHHRRLIDNGERFDTSMKRLVDWDFILRLTAFSRTAYAPFLGVSYYNGEGGHRITNTEHQNDLESLKIFLRAKHDPTRHALRNTPQNRPDWGEIRWMLGNRKIAIKIPAPYEKRHEWG